MTVRLWPDGHFASLTPVVGHLSVNPAEQREKKEFEIRFAYPFVSLPFPDTGVFYVRSTRRSAVRQQIDN